MRHHTLTHRTIDASVLTHHAQTRRERLPRLTHFALEYLLALPAGALIALMWANVAGESYFRFAHRLSFAVNDIAMVFFFALVTKEIVEAAAPGGVLHPWRRVVLPAVAAAGATLVPPLIYLAYIQTSDAPMFVRGWTVTLGCDLALGYFVMRAIYGRHPAVPFYLLLAIAANGVGFLVLPPDDPGRTVALFIAIGLMAAAFAVVAALRRSRVKSLWPYVIAGGGLSWSALFWGGYHPALALAPIVPFLPHAARDRGFFVDAQPDATDTLSRLELWCRHPAQVALFLFGLVNGGIVLRGLEVGMWAVPIATLAGRPLGIAVATLIALRAGIHLPAYVGWRDLLVIGLVAGIGFTMALFFATSVLAPGQVLSETKMGALVSVAGIGLAFAAARVLHVGHFARPSR